MRVLVIGGTGFIGPNVVRILTAQGNEIAVVHRGKSNPSLPPEVRQILADRAHLRDKRPEIESFGPEVVIDLIISSGAQAEALMRMCHGLTRRVLMISSMDVYRACGVLHGIDAGPLEPLRLTRNETKPQGEFITSPNGQPSQSWNGQRKSPPRCAGRENSSSSRRSEPPSISCRPPETLPSTG